MGDKSPKSKQKDKNQKQSKANAANKQKQRDIANKRGGEDRSEKVIPETGRIFEDFQTKLENGLHG